MAEEDEDDDDEDEEEETEEDAIDRIRLELAERFDDDVEKISDVQASRLLFTISKFETAKRPCFTA